MLIFDYSKKGRLNLAQCAVPERSTLPLPSTLLRKRALNLPNVSELQVIRHYTRLSQQNYSIDTHLYPLGSCTMKYNPRGVNRAASLDGFLNRHPLTPDAYGQGVLACLFDLQMFLCEITGMKGFSLTPMAGAQGEFAGIAMIRAYHLSRGDDKRDEVIVPDAAHGTNPATASMCGYRVREIPTDPQGDIDLDALKKALSSRTAAIMLTNPSTLGVFERRITDIADLVHEAGGLLYYDGANLNAILGKVRPGDMGFDAIHVNLHKTFATPHGGGGPGSGPVGVSEKLLPFLPIPIVGQKEQGLVLEGRDQHPLTIGRLSAFVGNVSVLLRAYGYLRLIGRENLSRISDFSVLNANFLSESLKRAGYEMAYPMRRVMHEFVLTLRKESKETGVRAIDYAKRLLDFGIHPPTIYFPLLVPESMLIEPTETEDLDSLNTFIEAMEKIRLESQENPERVKTAPHLLNYQRFDEVAAARKPCLRFRFEKN